MYIKSTRFIPYNKNLKLYVKGLRQNMTLAEKKLWFEYFRGHKYRFVRQKIVGNYILDFYCQRLKLGIEIDGATHIGKENEEADRCRTGELNALGIFIIRFWNDEVLLGLEAVCEKIEEEIRAIEAD